jgi:hypothetical protein
LGYVQWHDGYLYGKRGLHDENPEIRVLPVTPEISDVSGTLTSDADGHETALNSWAGLNAGGRLPTAAPARMS